MHHYRWFPASGRLALRLLFSIIYRVGETHALESCVCRVGTSKNYDSKFSSPCSTSFGCFRHCLGAATPGGAAGHPAYQQWRLAPRQRSASGARARSVGHGSLGAGSIRARGSGSAAGIARCIRSTICQPPASGPTSAAGLWPPGASHAQAWHFRVDADHARFGVQ
jgi:hypothetical protein